MALIGLLSGLFGLMRLALVPLFDVLFYSAAGALGACLKSLRRCYFMCSVYVIPGSSWHFSVYCLIF